MSKTEQYADQMEALIREYAARAERLDASQRLKYNDWREDISAEFQAAEDWSEATWKEFTAKAERRWHELGLNDSE